VVSNKRTLTCLLKPLFSMSRATTIAAALSLACFRHRISLIRLIARRLSADLPR
jgi:hypothetical protein